MNNLCSGIRSFHNSLFPPQANRIIRHQTSQKVNRRVHQAVAGTIRTQTVNLIKTELGEEVKWRNINKDLQLLLSDYEKD